MIPQQNKIRRTIHPEIKAVDASKGIFDVVASDQTVDQSREVIMAAGWKFTNFAKNAPLVDSHDASTIGNLVGKVTDFGVVNGQLVERIQWAVDVAENQLAVVGCKMMAAGYLRALSVGFMPVSYLTPQSGKDWTDALAALKLPSDSAVRCIYTQQEQVELSVCIIGCNPNALVKSGVLTEAEAALVPQTWQGKSELLSWAKGARNEAFHRKMNRYLANGRGEATQD